MARIPASLIVGHIVQSQNFSVFSDCNIVSIVLEKEEILSISFYIGKIFINIWSSIERNVVNSNSSNRQLSLWHK